MDERVKNLETEGVVLSKNGFEAIVEIQRVNACTGNCKDCAGCETKKMQVAVYTDLAVVSGDRVRIFSEEKPVLFGLFVVFIVPLILPVLAYLLTVKSGLGGCFAVGGLALSLVLIWRLNRSRWYFKKTQPRIIEVISKK